PFTYSFFVWVIRPYLQIQVTNLTFWGICELNLLVVFNTPMLIIHVPAILYYELPSRGFNCCLECVLPHVVLVCDCDFHRRRRGFSFLPCWLVGVSFLAGCWLLLLARL